MQVLQLAPGLWRWTAPDPAWTPADGGAEGWEPEVASCYCESEGAIVLIDPIVPADPADGERFWRALDRDVERLGPPQVVLTCERHARSTPVVLARYPDSRTRAADDLPGGVSAIAGLVDGDNLLWLPSYRALVAGDTLHGGGPAGVRLCPDSWLGAADPRAARVALRKRLAGLAVDRVLPSHGPSLVSGGRAALDLILA